MLLLFKEMCYYAQFGIQFTGDRCVLGLCSRFPAVYSRRVKGGSFAVNQETMVRIWIVRILLCGLRHPAFQSLSDALFSIFWVPKQALEPYLQTFLAYLVMVCQETEDLVIGIIRNTGILWGQMSGPLNKHAPSSKFFFYTLFFLFFLLCKSLRLI